MKSSLSILLTELLTVKLVMQLFSQDESPILSLNKADQPKNFHISQDNILFLRKNFS